MSFIFDSVNWSPFVFAVDIVWKVSVILAVALLLTLAARRVSASIKHAILSSALAGCLLIPIVALIVPSWKITDLATWLQTTDSQTDSENLAHRLVPAELPSIEIRSGNTAMSPGQDVSQRTKSPTTDNRVASSAIPAISANQSHQTFMEQSLSPVPSLFGWTIAFWFAGFTLSLLPLVIAAIQKRKWLSNSVVLDDPEWSRLIRETSSQLGISRPIQIRQLEQQTIPVTWGAIRPIVLVPVSADHWDLSRRRSVLLHELAHIKRNDFPVQLMSCWVVAVYWFHPLVWVCVMKLRYERELACDDCVVNSGQQASLYAADLVNIAETSQSVPRVRRLTNCLENGVAMARNSKLKSRLESMFDLRRSHRSNSKRITVLVGLLSLVASITVGSFGGNVDEQVAEQETNSSKDPDSLGDELPEGALMRLGSIRFQHPDNVDAIALSTDEKTIVSLSSETLIGWDAETGKKKWQENPELGIIGTGLVFSSATYGVRPIQFIPGTNKFYCSGQRGVVAIWDADTGERVELDLDTSGVDFRVTGPVKSIDVSDEGEFLALGTAHYLIVCDTQGKAQGRALYSIANKPAAAINSLAEPRDRMAFGGEYSYARFSSDQELLAVANSESPNKIQVVKAADGEHVRDIELSKRLVRMDFTPFGDKIITTERDCSVRMYDVESGERLWSYELDIKNSAESYTHDVAVSPDGQLAAVCAPMGPDHRIRVIEVDSGKEIGSLTGHGWKPMSVVFTEDGDRLYSSGWDGTILRWNMETLEPIPLTEGERTTGMCAASPTANVIAYTTAEGVIKVLNPSNGDTIRSIEAAGICEHALTFSPDGSRLVAGGTSEDNTILTVWNVATGEQVDQWSWPIGRDPHSSITAISFSPAGDRIAASVFRQSAGYAFEFGNKDLVFRLKHQSIFGLSFDPGNSTLTTVGWDSSIKFWSAESGEPLPTGNIDFPAPGADRDDLRIYGVRCSPDGERFATLHMRSRLRLWNSRDQKMISEYMPDQFEGVTTGSLNFSTDGTWLATGSRKGMVRIFDSITGDLVLEKQAHQDSVIAISFGCHGQTLLTGGSDGVSYLWSLRPEIADQKPVLELYPDLVSNDAVAAFQAHWAMVEQPGETVELLEKKMLSDEILDGDQLELLRPLAVLNTIGSDQAKQLLRSISERYADKYVGQQAQRLSDQ